MSCIDLIFSQPNLVMSSAIHLSIHHLTNVRYGILKERIQIISYPWERSFANLDKNDKVYLFNETIKTILSNFIPYETITFEDRDSLWINSQVEHLINEKKCSIQKLSQK